ncbi:MULTISPECIES: sulfatase-like hydrolase/transferase [unclassified Paenibacillus]|uniref:sulfatase-like hydrolase/transferase n=1 Tax=unclassified Paenibacillus TaxID=185978 RepID=UPI00362816AA
MKEMTQKRPNIVFILSDDQGAWAMGCAGNSEIRTPNLDRIASEGMRFSSFFCTSPVCSPARASLLTGRIPSQHGVHDWICEDPAGAESPEYLQGQIGYTDILKANGYHCGISGKWHLGNSFQAQKGFSYWYVHQSGGGPYYNAPMISNGQLHHEEGYVTDAITDGALRFLDKVDDSQPFYLSVHYTAPHSPWVNNHPKDIVDSYEDCPFTSCPQEQPHPWAIKTTPWGDDTKQNLQGYFAAVTAMDQNIGRILDKLDNMEVREKTLICFMSDNGFSCGHHGFWGKGNGTFPQNMYDSSVKVPALFSQPGRIPQGIVCDELVSGYDFMPTLLEYVGLEKPEHADILPGKSFVPLLLGEQSANENPIVVFDEYGPVRMIRTKEWKYVHRYPDGPHELYDLLHDPEEIYNLIDCKTQAEKISEMKACLESWFVRYVDPVLDGMKEPVSGNGQLNLIGPAGNGEKAF